MVIIIVRLDLLLIHIIRNSFIDFILFIYTCRFTLIELQSMNYLFTHELNLNLGGICLLNPLLDRIGRNGFRDSAPKLNS